MTQDMAFIEWIEGLKVTHLHASGVRKIPPWMVVNSLHVLG